MHLGTLFEAIAYHLLIGGIVNLGHQDEVPMVSVLVCIVTHWIRPTVSHDIRLSGSYDFTKPLYYVVSQP